MLGAGGVLDTETARLVESFPRFTSLVEPVDEPVGILNGFRRLDRKALDLLGRYGEAQFAAADGAKAVHISISIIV